ncbi:YlcI/YnfO family protein [Solwaraspora sp. WMMD406]|uniref:YlcI/YnfO family protein n=1 Tax=Solwaraspora sp. WMMD406 TaxID=3016095 RepID=UPI002417AA3E|nr:YlcI/YnfO family protein [Solwaraspora sp. WMMD406]MDG4766345.1 YlcI/YnfO family protein [Solwaraspora sp. WMMD406]
MAEMVTLRLSPQTLAQARAAAEREGVTLSDWIDRAARREARRDADRAHEEWLAANPEVRAELDAFDQLADTLECGWSDLSDAA